MSHRQTHRQTHRHTQTEKRAKTVLLKIHFQPFWTLLVDCSHVISQMVRFGSFSCGPHIGHVMINFLFILESTVYDCLNHKMTVFGPKKAKCGRNITILEKAKLSDPCLLRLRVSNRRGSHISQFQSGPNGK